MNTIERSLSKISGFLPPSPGQFFNQATHWMIQIYKKLPGSAFTSAYLYRGEVSAVTCV